MKTTFLLALISTFYTLLSASSAEALTFNFSQKGFSGEPFFQGTFTGEDINNDNRIELQELNNFQALLVPGSVSFSRENLGDFEYILETTNSIFVGVSKQVDIFDEFADYALYDLGVNGLASFFY